MCADGQRKQENIFVINLRERNPEEYMLSTKWKQKCCLKCIFFEEIIDKISH